MLFVSQIDEQLKNLYVALLPESISRKRKKEIFNYSGPFGTLSSKLDIAFVCRLLPSGLIESVHQIRKIRNEVAHSTEPFFLKDYQNDLRAAYSLVGENADKGIYRTALDSMMHNFLAHITEIILPDQEKPYFETIDSAIDYLEQNEEVTGLLENSIYKWELMVALGIICGIILLHRDTVSNSFTEKDTLYGLISSSPGKT